jgi:hypothetical protein
MELEILHVSIRSTLSEGESAALVHVDSVVEAVAPNQQYRAGTAIGRHEDLRAEPLAGRMLVLDVGVAGLPPVSFLPTAAVS